jgi:hypothetical protein
MEAPEGFSLFQSNPATSAFPTPAAKPAPARLPTSPFASAQARYLQMRILWTYEGV